MFKLASDLESVYTDLRFDISRRCFAKIVREVQRYVSASPWAIVDFINGGSEGWNMPQEEQQAYYDHHTTHQIADWIIAGLK